MGNGRSITTLVSPNSQIEPFGRPLAADRSASDPIDATDRVSETQEPKSSDEEGNLRSAIEIDLRKMTIEQGLIEIDFERYHVDSNWEDGKDVEGFTPDALGEDNERDVANTKGISHPLRSDAEDCSFFMKYGSCKFGLSCKFNHPTWRKNQGFKERPNHTDQNSERAAECKYYLKFGGCKFGKDCKYSHDPDKSSASQIQEFNFLGLPIRPEEPECSFYMRFGSCKYGENCRFHHPEPTAVVGGDHSSGYRNGETLPSHLLSSSISSWSLPKSFNETSPFRPLLSPPRQGPSNSNTEWNGYQAATYPTSERGLPIPPAFSANGLSMEINFPVLRQHDKLFEEYPERPGEPECSFFMRTGECKFKSNCKFHHPKNRVPKAKPSSSYALNKKGLPVRSDQPICTYYYRFGICKYGPACKYDHSTNFLLCQQATGLWNLHKELNSGLN